MIAMLGLWRGSIGSYKHLALTQFTHEELTSFSTQDLNALNL